MMAHRALFVLLTSMLAVTGCGQQPRQQQTTNPQYQNNPAQTNQVNPNIDCTPITNPNYVSGGNQAQYYYPEGGQQNGTRASNSAGYNNGENSQSRMGGYVGAAAVGVAAGALANRAYNTRNKNKTTPAVTPNYNRTQNNRTYTPTTNRNSSVYRSGNSNRATARAPNRRR